MDASFFMDSRNQSLITASRSSFTYLLSLNVPLMLYAWRHWDNIQILGEKSSPGTSKSTCIAITILLQNLLNWIQWHRCLSIACSLTMLLANSSDCFIAYCSSCIHIFESLGMRKFPGQYFKSTLVPSFHFHFSTMYSEYYLALTQFLFKTRVWYQLL